MNEDAELLRRYVEQASEADFTALVDRHIALVYATALRGLGGDAHLAQDVAQTVFCDLARKAHTLGSRPSIAGWLYVSTHHAAAAVVRCEQRRKAREIRAHTMNAADAGEIPNLDWERIRPVLDAAMVELGDADREAVVLRYFQQRPLADVGRALRVTEDAARKRVDRALDKLRDALLKRGIVSTSAALGLALNAAPISITPPIAASVASHALKSAAATPAGIVALTVKTLPFAAVLAVGGWLVLHQRATNDRLREQVGQLVAMEKSAAALREENAALRREKADSERLREVAAQLPALRARAAAMVTPTERHRATVTVTPDGRLQWGDRPVTLNRFLRELKVLQASDPANEAALTIRAHGASFSAFAYTIDEARKIGIRHLIVESDTPMDPKVGRSWF